MTAVAQPCKLRSDHRKLPPKEDWKRPPHAERFDGLTLQRFEEMQAFVIPSSFG
jgi:hypothetical protein